MPPPSLAPSIGSTGVSYPTSSRSRDATGPSRHAKRYACCSATVARPKALAVW